jgi:hypothetical protein
MALLTSTVLTASSSVRHAGRVLIGQGAIDACKIGLTIAIRYGAMRPQFGDKLVIEYLTHQRRLMPGLASTYAHHLAMGHLKDVFCAKRPEDGKVIHVLSSGLKAAATWTRVEVGGGPGGLAWCCEQGGGLAWCCDVKHADVAG